MNYGLPLLLNSDYKLLLKLNKSIVMTARFVIGSLCFKWLYIRILNRVVWLPIFQMVNLASIKLFCYIIETQKPKPIFELLRTGQCKSRYTRNVIKYYLLKK